MLTNNLLLVCIFLLYSAPPVILNRIPVQEILAETTSCLICDIDRGNPLGNVHWLRVDNETGNVIEITGTSDPRFRKVENGLEITSVQLSDEGIYRCYVFNQYGADSFDIQALYRGEITHMHEYNLEHVSLILLLMHCMHI